MTTRDEIQAMAMDAGAVGVPMRPRPVWEFTPDQLVEFFRLAQAAAYERAAKELSENRHMFFTDAGCESMCRGILALKEQA